MKNNVKDDMGNEIRLQKFLSQAGVTSRRKAEDMIRHKKISINGQLVTELGKKVNPLRDVVKIAGKPVIVRQEAKVYIMLNKPRGVLCTLHDDRDRACVTDLIKLKTRIYPVGRLDYNSEGLLLLTNDGEFTNRISHPKNKIVKIYQVRIKGIPTEKTLKKMKHGVSIDGVFMKFEDVRISRSTGKNSWITVSLQEGKNREIRMVCERLGHLVIKLKRIKLGGVSIGKLPVGQYRYLTSMEYRKLTQVGKK